MPRYRIYEPGFDSLVEIDITPSKLLEYLQEYVNANRIISHHLWFKFLREKHVKVMVLFSTEDIENSLPSTAD